MKRRVMKVNRKNSRGSVAIEIAAGALVSIGLMALALNVCFGMLAYGVNDRACREAARAAAQQSTLASASSIAKYVVNGFNQNNSYMNKIQVTRVVFTDFNGLPPEDQSPFVSVTTSSSVATPAPIAFFGQKVFGESIPVQKTYTFPIVRLNVNTNS